jgi:riboflavin kinase/FMN adenylyltransferase
MVVAATGFFDGVHLGHRKVLGALSEIARSEGKRSAVISFWPHPRSVLQQEAYNLRLLNTSEEKEALVKSIGIDEIIYIPFTKEFSKLSTKEFMQQYLIEKYKVSVLVIGYDHRLGNNISESQQQMISTAESLGLRVVRVSEFLMDDNIISSTKIRRLLQQTDVEGAAKFLGYNYFLKGVVVSGNRIGRTIGFPTANMKLYNPLKEVPGNGVYAVYVNVLGKRYMGITNIGTRPTVGNGNERTIETNILNFNEDIYGLDISVEFVFKIRDERKFNSLDDLKCELALNRDYALEKLSAGL